MMNHASIVFTDEQESVIQAVLKWADERPKQTITIGGLAGTGKSVTAKEIVRRIHHLGIERKQWTSVAVAAFTGKAANNLQRKGIPFAQTLHSLMYEPSDDGTKVTFRRRPELAYSYVLVDEASMLSEELLNDLLAFNVPVILIGDHGQLEPIGKNPGVMKTPELTLTQIHRQAAESNIIKFAHAVRQGQPYRPPEGATDMRFATRRDVVTRLNEFDQIICGFNKTRVLMNQMMRERLGVADTTVSVGERLICLKNDREAGVFNGMSATVDAVGSESERFITLDLTIDGGAKLEDVRCVKGTFDGSMDSEAIFRTVPRGVLAFTYGYAVTLHKAQGSQWPKLLVVEEIASKWDRRRWIYTAVTRAEKELTYVRGGYAPAF